MKPDMKGQIDELEWVFAETDMHVTNSLIFTVIC